MKYEPCTSKSVTKTFQLTWCTSFLDHPLKVQQPSPSHDPSSLFRDSLKWVAAQVTEFPVFEDDETGVIVTSPTKELRSELATIMHGEPHIVLNDNKRFCALIIPASQHHHV